MAVRDETGAVTVKTYNAPLATLTLEGAAITVVASGFLDSTQNSNGPSFGLWVATAQGLNLIPLPERTGTATRPVFNADNIKVYPNPATSGILNVELAERERIDMIGVFSTNGALVYRQAMGNSNIGQVRLPAGLDKGVYLLQVVTETGTGFQKFVIQ